MRHFHVCALSVLVTMGAVACGGEDDGTAGTSGAQGGSGGEGIGGSGGSPSASSAATSAGGADNTGGARSGGSGGAGGAGTGGTGEAAAPEAPVVKSVLPMAGGLHVTWENKTADCEKILLDRKFQDGDYATEYTLVGVATEHHDGAASEGGTYCYKARCERGGVASPDSNEKCGSP